MIYNDRATFISPQEHKQRRKHELGVRINSTLLENTSLVPLARPYISSPALTVVGGASVPRGSGRHAGERFDYIGITLEAKPAKTCVAIFLFTSRDYCHFRKGLAGNHLARAPLGEGHGRGKSIASVK